MIPAKSIREAIKRQMAMDDDTLSNDLVGHAALSDPIFGAAIKGTVDYILDHAEPKITKSQAITIAKAVAVTALQYFHMGYDQASLENKGLKTIM